MSTNTGGPAFPTMAYEHGGEADGMTLLDWLAANIANGLFSTDPISWDDTSAQRVAAYAYTCAEAMLAERERRMKEKP